MKASILILTLVAIFSYTYEEVSKADRQPQVQTYSTTRPVITYDEGKGRIMVRVEDSPFCYKDLNAAHQNYLRSLSGGC